MGIQRSTDQKRRTIEKSIILLFCTLIAIGTMCFLLFGYRPNMNSINALASVCMDAICIVILLVLVINLMLEKAQTSRTTSLFLCLMLGTMYGLFFDFLNWAYDGSLAYGDITFFYTVASLCGGAVAAGIFVLYLSSYLDEMHGMKAALIRAKIYAACNIVAFVITIVLAITGDAFVFVDGHYKTGALYDYVTAIPVLTLLLMTAYAVRNFKTIGIRDVIAVTGYILFMIAGALIEASFSIGTTYVAVAIADIFIFVMLQNKVLDRMREQREELTEEVASQFEILESMAGIYSHVNYVDFEEMITRRFDVMDSQDEALNLEAESHSFLNRELYKGIEDEQKEKFLAYTDLSTLSVRMSGEKIISAEFCHKTDGWFRAQYIRIGDNVDEPINRVIYAIRNIDEEKKNVEEWIRKSNTDELTGLLNRHAYEDELVALSERKIMDNFVYVSIDVNSLKIVNDSLGHDAGDELLVGASECMRQSYGAYGKLFRTGGDEFVALIFADNSQLAEIKKDIEEITENWSGKLIDHLAVSCGYVTGREAGNMTLHEIAVLADKRMYEAKTKYYQQQGIDRRGQRDAHVALCALYTKILKINLSDDTYQIINMNEDEKTSEKGFAEHISEWLRAFGTSGQVHPDDLQQYLRKTELAYISDYFRGHKDSLSVFYRRKYDDCYKQVMMEMIPANDYSDETQNLFLYVKNIEQ